VATWLDVAAGCRPAEASVVVEIDDDELLALAADAVVEVPPPLVAEEVPSCDSSRHPVRATAPATLTAAAIRRPVRAG
jgi:hypothetical protein